MNIVQQQVSLIACTPLAERLIERAGRLCYKSEPKYPDDPIRSAREFIHKRIREGHLSVIEHAVATVQVVCDRGITHELVRHRLASYSQESTRYCDYGGSGITVVEHPGATDETSDAFSEFAEFCESFYQGALDAGDPPQLARRFLPIGLKTEIIMTANLREWRHVIQLRAGIAAHPQIRLVAGAVLNLLHSHVPSVFAGLYTHPDIRESAVKAMHLGIGLDELVVGNADEPVLAHAPKDIDLG